LVYIAMVDLTTTTTIGGANIPSYNSWDICVEVVVGWFDCTSVGANLTCWCCLCIDVSINRCKF
jgi:hypothetical protein